jgi:hypothetical protein
MRQKIIGAPKNFKNWLRPLFACHQKPNLSREKVPLKVVGYEKLGMSRC